MLAALLLFVIAGTSLKYRPGVLLGGAGLSHDCGSSRSIGYFLEPLLVLGLFGKRVSAATASWLQQTDQLTLVRHLAYFVRMRDVYSSACEHCRIVHRQLMSCPPASLGNPSCGLIRSLVRNP